MVQRIRLAVNGVMVVSASEAMVVSATAVSTTVVSATVVSATVVSISPQRHTLARHGDRNIGKTQLVIGTMLGITRFLNGSPSLNEAARMLGTDSIPRWHGARSCGAYQGLGRELCNVTTSKGL